MTPGLRTSPGGGAARCWVVLAAGLMPLLAAACVSPDSFAREADGGDQGTGGQTQSGSGGSNGGGQGGSSGGQGGRGMGGNVSPGVGGRVAGTGGAVIGPDASLTDNFENGAGMWLAPQSSDSTPCGTWVVVPEPGNPTNHIYQQSLSTCSGNPSWAAGGNLRWTDMRIQAKVMFPAGATTVTLITLGVRYGDGKNMYFLEYSNDGKLKIRAKINGSSTDAASDVSKNRVAVQAGQWVTIGLAISGGTASAYLGDRTTTASISGPASGLTAGGVAIGVQGGTASFDDILVTPP